MLHWLYHQLYLTWLQIQQDITIPHIVTGSIAYGIIHRFYKISRRERLSLLKHLGDSRQKLVWIHIKSGHKGRYTTCKECRAIRELNQAQALPQPEQQA